MPRPKISLANFSFRGSLSPEDGSRPVREGAPNGLENPENRRSAGRHGNQHVYVRDPQVSGSAFSDLAQVDLGPETFPIAGACPSLSPPRVYFAFRR